MQSPKPRFAATTPTTAPHSDTRQNAPALSVGDLARTTQPPVIILGGDANAVSLVREFGRRGIDVYVIAEPDTSVAYSRYCEVVEVPGDGKLEERWTNFLLGGGARRLSGAVLLACSDAALRVISRNYHQLAERFRLDVCNPPAQLAMLDKLATLKIARAAGVPTPKFWEIGTRADIESVASELVFPLLVKPRLSHVFQQHFGKKFLVANSHQELLDAFDKTAGIGMDMLLVEMLPGGDELLCSYYTYLDEHGRPLFDFTKRIIRRYPTGWGGGCYHITDWIPQIVEPALELFRAAGLQGLANVEFKFDPRDGQYKLIECNARYTAANCLVAASGLELGSLVYNRIVGLPLPQMTHYAHGLRLWDPVRDFRSFLELRRMGKLTLRQWLASVMHLHTFAYGSLRDPMPLVSRLLKPLFRLFRWTKT